MFCKNYSFRYSDIDYKEQVKISTVIDMLQDISIIHSAEVGYPRDRLVSMSIAWLLLGWRIKFLAPLDKNKSVTVRTGIMSIRKYEASRKYEIIQDGECKIIATAVWFTVNIDKMRVMRAPEEIYAAYDCVNEEDNGIEFIKLRGKDDLEELAGLKVERRDIDTNNHMNNVRSVEVALDYLPKNTKISELQVTYRKSLYACEDIKICMQKNDGEYFVEIVNSNGEPSVMINAIQA